MASKIYIQVFVALVLLSQSVFSLKCYTCNSAKDEGCSASPPPEKYLMECSHDTMEILNDFHRQTKLEEAASTKHDHGHDHDDSEHGHEHHRHEMESMPAASTAATPLEDPSESTHLPDASTPATLANDRQARSVDAANVNEPGSLITAPVKLPKEATFCRKNSYHIPEQVNGPDSKFESTIRIIRTCGWIAEEKKEGPSNNKTDCKWIVNAGTQIDQCVCTGDGCNAGGYLESLKTHTLILFAVITGSYYYVL